MFRTLAESTFGHWRNNLNHHRSSTRPLHLATAVLSTLTLAAGLAHAGKPGAGTGGGGTTTPTTATAALGGHAYSVNVDLTVDITGLDGTLDLLNLSGSPLVSLKVGPVPYAKLPKYGGVEIENLATLQVLDLVGSGTLLNVSAGGAGAKKAGSTSVSVVEKLSLLGLIKADLIGASCSSSSNYSTSRSSADSTLVGLTINGKTISASTPRTPAST